MDVNKDIAIFRQVCEVNDLDPETIRSIAQERTGDTASADQLIRTAFNYKARLAVKGLELGSTSGSEHIQEGEEYSLSSDPAAPSFVINEDFIHRKYSEGEAQRLIDALRDVRMPVTG